MWEKGKGSAMDNSVNENRRRISDLRSEMGRVEAAMHAEIARDLDCSAAALRLMSLRAEVAELAKLRIRIGDNAPIGARDLRKPRFARG
jgi:hypothetical protein